jgi:hypothetical protein
MVVASTTTPAVNVATATASASVCDTHSGAMFAGTKGAKMGVIFSDFKRFLAIFQCSKNYFKKKMEILANRL